jgi:hypothetical protein
MDLRIRRRKLVPRLLPIRKGRKWLYVGFIALPCILILLIFGLPALLGPRLSYSQKQWKEFHGDDPKGYPLEVVSHGYRMIRAYRSKPEKTQRTQSRSVNLVEWEWKVVIKNKSNRDENILVNYFLVDKDQLRVDVDYMISPKQAPAWETVTIQHKTEMVYEDLHRIATGVWEISGDVEKSLLQKRRRGQSQK